MAHIELKFDVLDKVWFLHNNKAHHEDIQKIQAIREYTGGTYAKDSYVWSIRYGFKLGAGEILFVAERDCYGTKDELLKSI